jgi:hypothetical protein
MAEVLLESHLNQAKLKQDQIDLIMYTRDQLLRYVASESGRRTSLSVANALRDARNDEHLLEIELVESFRNIGFDATRLGGKGKPDGVAKAHLSPSEDNRPRRYAVLLEAKSKKKEGTKLKTKNLGVSAIVRLRDEYNCEHAVVVAPAFEHTLGKESALSKEIKADREMTAANGKPRTITAMHIDDLARLVQLRPVKRLGLDRIRDLFQTCSLPEECKAWVDKVEKEVVLKPPYEQIIKTIHSLQQEYQKAAVEYGDLRVALGRNNPPYKVDQNEELRELCKAMSALAGSEIISSTERTVELNQSPENVLIAIESATKLQLGANKIIKADK